MAVYIKVKCPHCGNEDVVLFGKNSTGKQRLECRNSECKFRTFQLEYKYNGCRPEVKNKIVEMSVNGSGVRDTGRVLKISPGTVISVLKKRKNSLNK